MIIFGMKNKYQFIHKKIVCTLPLEIVEIVRSLIYFRFKNEFELRDAVNMWCSSRDNTKELLKNIGISLVGM